MMKFRAATAFLLALLWCAQVLHGQLESAGLMFDHEHVADHVHEDGSSHGGQVEAEHEPVFAREASRELQISDGTQGVLGLLTFGLWAALLVAPRRGESVARELSLRRRREPHWSGVWQFVWRCAPDSAAPPVLG